MSSKKKITRKYLLTKHKVDVTLTSYETMMLTTVLTDLILGYDRPHKTPEYKKSAMRILKKIKNSKEYWDSVSEWVSKDVV